MKILYINALYSPYIAGGAEISLKLLVEGMQAQGHEVLVLSLVPHGPLIQELVDGVKVYRTGLKNGYWPFDAGKPGTGRRLSWHLRDRYNRAMKAVVEQVLALEKPHVVSCHNLVGWSVAVWDAVRHAGIPIVQVLHDMYLLCPNSNMFKNGHPCESQCFSCRVLRVGHRERSAMVSAVVGISQSILGRFKEAGYFAGAYSAVIHNARHIPAPGKPYGRRAGEPLRIGYIGTLSKIKGIEWLISQFKASGLDATLTLAGSGKADYETYLRQLVRDDERIRFAGYVKAADFYPQIDLLVVPSLWQEPLGMVAIEGLANNLPVIASNLGGLREIVQDGKNGILCDPEDPASLGRALTALCLDTERYRQLAGAARQSVQPMLSTARMTNEYEQVLKQLVNVPL